MLSNLGVSQARPPYGSANGIICLVLCISNDDSCPVIYEEYKSGECGQHRNGLLVLGKFEVKVHSDSFCQVKFNRTCD